MWRLWASTITKMRYSESIGSLTVLCSLPSIKLRVLSLRKQGSKQRTLPVYTAYDTQDYILRSHTRSKDRLTYKTHLLKRTRWGFLSLGHFPDMLQFPPLQLLSPAWKYTQSQTTKCSAFSKVVKCGGVRYTLLSFLVCGCKANQLTFDIRRQLQNICVMLST